MSRQTTWFAAALAVMLLHGCAASTQVRVDFDPKENFPSLRSYAWAPPTDEERATKSRDSLTHERIQAAIEVHLNARGYRKADATQADFLVTHTVTTESRTQVSQSTMSVGYGRYGAHGGVGVGYGMPVNTQVYQYKVGTLVIDVINAKQQRLVWRGAGERTLEQNLSPAERETLINTVVNDILGRFPPGAEKK